MPEGVPLQSLSRLPGWPTVWRSTPASRGSLALQRRPSTGPRMRQTCPGPPRFRPRGFSPPRRFPGSIELAGLFHPAAVPGLFSPFRAFPSRQVAHPSSGLLAPLPFVPVEPRCGERGLVTSGLHRLGRRSGVVPGRILPRLEAPFQRRSSHNLAAARLATPPGHPGPRTPDPPRSGRSVDFEAFFPARIPFTPRDGHPSRGGRCSPGRPRPSRALLPPNLGPSTRHGRRRPSSRWLATCTSRRTCVRPPGSPCSGHFSWLAPRALRCWKPSTSGGIARGRPKRPTRSVGGHRILDEE
jgi:hypothetical protein